MGVGLSQNDGPQGSRSPALALSDRTTPCESSRTHSPLISCLQNRSALGSNQSPATSVNALQHTALDKHLSPCTSRNQCLLNRHVDIGKRSNRSEHCRREAGAQQSKASRVAFNTMINALHAIHQHWRLTMHHVLRYVRPIARSSAMHLMPKPLVGKKASLKVLWRHR